MRVLIYDCDNSCYLPTSYVMIIPDLPKIVKLVAKFNNFAISCAIRPLFAISALFRQFNNFVTSS